MSQTATRTGITVLILILLAVAPSPGALGAQNGGLLWQIGKPDNNDAEFALAPNRYGQFREDGVFVPGQSDPKRDWPYVHPGPGDAWAGGRAHTFAVVFGLKAASADGQCRLMFDLLDTHGANPPALRIEINGKSFTEQMPRGGGDESVFGNPAKGKEHKFQIAFPANLLRAGANEIDITTISGSWILYDWLGLEAPAGLELGPVRGTVVRSMQTVPVLIRKDGKLFQSIQMSVRHFGEDAEATVRITGADPVTLSVRRGANSLEVPVPAVEAETPITVQVESAGKTIATQQQTLKPVRKWVLYFLPHSHVDIGYTDVQTNVEKRQWRHLEDAIAACRRTANYPPGARFKWNVEVLWAVDGYLRQASPEKQHDFIDAVQEGLVGLEALYGNELTGLCRPEELMRLTSACAQKLSQRANVPIDAAMISDVPGYTWGIVPALAQSGVKYFSVGPNGGDRIGWTLAAWGDKPFYWVSPSGQERVLCWIAGTGYGLFHGAGLGRQGGQPIFNHLRRLEDNKYPYDLVQVRYSTGGDNGPPDPSICEFIRDWNAKYAYPRLVIATASEMCRDLEKQYGDKLPVVKGDFTPYWEDGAASSSRETAMNRDAAERLVQAETLFAMLDPSRYPADAFYAAWRNAILYDEHTWGAHNSISEPDKQFVKDQWKIKQAFAVDADAQSRKLLADGLALRGEPAGNIPAVDVFNTCSFARSDLVVLPKAMQLAGSCVKDPAGAIVPSQRLAGGELAFIVRDLPPFSGRRYVISAEAAAVGGTARAEGTAVQNGILALRVDPNTGAISSFRSASTDAELVDSKAGGLNEYIYLPGSDVKDAQRNGPAKMTVKETGPVVASLLVESDAPGCNKLTREIRLVDGLDRAEIINTVDKKPIRTKEGVHFSFSFNVPDGVVRVDSPWAVVRPEIDQLPGACKNWFTVQRWVDVSNDRLGVTWAVVDAPLVEVGGLTANLIGSQSNPKAWIEHLGPSQVLYSWAMNNHWHTNYKADQEGPTVFRYALRPHAAYSADEAARFGISMSQPLIASPAAGPAPAAGPRLTLDASGVLVTAFKPSEDGKAWIVRLFAASGKPERVKVSWSEPRPRAVFISDLSEKPLRQADGVIEVPAYGIATMRAER